MPHPGWPGGPPPPYAGGGPPGFYPPHPPHPPAPPPRPLWTEHRGKDGRTYWYNRETKKSSWEKPEALGGVAGAAGAPTAATPWREVKAPDGRPYFYNRETKASVWVCPPELAAAREKAAAASGGRAPHPHAAAAAAAPPPGQLPGAAAAAARAASAARNGGKFMYGTKAEAKAAFCELLAAAGARSTDAWDAVAPSISADPRFAALKSAGERRACFTEYRAAAAKKEAAAARAARGAAREAFTDLLSTCGLDPASARFADAEGFLGPDPRWSGLDRVLAAAAAPAGPGGPPPAAAAAAARREKEDLFEDWRRAAERAAREALKAACEAAVEGAAAWVARRGWVGGETRWREAEGRLEAEAGDEPGGNPFAAADRPTRLAGFARALRRAWEASDGEAAKAAAARARSERRARDAFRAALASHAGAGLVPPRSRWREYRARLRGGGFGGGAAGDGAGAAALEALEAPSAAGPRPRSLFEDALADVEARFLVQRAALLSAAVQGAGITVSKSVADGTAPGAAADLATLRLAFDDAADAGGGAAGSAGGGVRDLVWAELVGCASAGRALAFGDEAAAEEAARRSRTRSRSPARRGDREDRRSRRGRSPGGGSSDDGRNRRSRREEHHHRHARHRREEEDQEEGEL